MANTPIAGRNKPTSLDSNNLERSLARAVVSLVRSHQEVMRRHRAIVITVFIDRKTGEIRESFVVAGRE